MEHCHHAPLYRKLKNMRKRRKGKLSRLDANLRPVLRQMGKRQRGVHPEIWARWCDIVGQDLAQRVIPRSLFGNTLTVAVASSSWMQHMTYIKPALLDQLAEEIGPTVVKEIRFTLDHTLAHHQRRNHTIKKPPSAPAEVLPLEIASATNGIKDKSLREIMEKAAKASLGRDS